jgi:alpha-D-xyloside xylohydrolase
MIRIRHALLVLAAAMCASAAHAADTAWRSMPDGIVVTPAEGPARSVRLQVMSDKIIHVIASPAADATPPHSLMVVAQPATQGFTVKTAGDIVSLATGKTTARISLRTGAVTFLDAAGKPVLAEYARTITPTRADGRPFYTVRQEFNRGSDEGFFGLGQHQNRQTNLNGQDVVLAQHNMDVAVPFVVSTNNYGVLWSKASLIAASCGTARSKRTFPACTSSASTSAATSSSSSTAR